MNFSHVRLFGVLLLVFRTLLTNAQQPIYLSDSKKTYDHSDAFLYLKDDGRVYSSKDFYDPAFTGAFSPAGGKHFNFGLTSAAIWYRFRLVNVTGERWMLKAENPTVQEVTLFTPHASGNIDSVHITLLDKMSMRPWRNNQYFFTLPFPDSSIQEFYLRITSDHSMTIPPQIATVDSF